MKGAHRQYGHQTSVATLVTGAMASGAERSPVPSDEPKERLSEPEAAERLSEPGASPSEGSEIPAWLQYVTRHVLSASAEAHRDMENKVSPSSDEPKHNLATIKIENVNGDSSVTVYAYRTWKKRECWRRRGSTS